MLLLLRWSVGVFIFVLVSLCICVVLFGWRVDVCAPKASARLGWDEVLFSGSVNGACNDDLARDETSLCALGSPNPAVAANKFMFSYIGLRQLEVWRVLK